MNRSYIVVILLYAFFMLNACATKLNYVEFVDKGERECIINSNAVKIIFEIFEAASNTTFYSELNEVEKDIFTDEVIYASCRTDNIRLYKDQTSINIIEHNKKFPVFYASYYEGGEFGSKDFKHYDLFIMRGGSIFFLIIGNYIVYTGLGQAGLDAMFDVRAGFLESLQYHPENGALSFDKKFKERVWVFR